MLLCFQCNFALPVYTCPFTRPHSVLIASILINEAHLSLIRRRVMSIDGGEGVLYLAASLVIKTTYCRWGKWWVRLDGRPACPVGWLTRALNAPVVVMHQAKRFGREIKITIGHLMHLTTSGWWWRISVVEKMIIFLQDIQPLPFLPA